MVNEDIKYNKIKIVNIGNDNILDLNEALDEADEQGLDLVQVGEDNDIAICKLMDYAKYIYDKEKKAKDNKQKKKVVKDIKIVYGIADHDIKIKIKNIERILKGGDSVKVTIMFKGRTIKLIDSGKEILSNIINELSVQYRIDRDIVKEGNYLFFIVAPK